MRYNDMIITLTCTMTHTYTATDIDIGRFDKIATHAFGLSRAKIIARIESGELLLNGMPAKPSAKVNSGDILTIARLEDAPLIDLPQDIALDIAYEDEALLVVNKPKGLIVHPGAGAPDGTLVNALLHHHSAQSALPRAGLVHRIDKDTTGLLLVAKTLDSYYDLTQKLANKHIERAYVAVASGSVAHLLRHARIDAPIGRHPRIRTKMAVVGAGKEAITHIAQAHPLAEHYSLVDIRLQTGRTHQIRVHFAHIGAPLVGDALYGANVKVGLDAHTRHIVQQFDRQALHAHTLRFTHPNGRQMAVRCAVPDDLCALVASFGMDMPEQFLLQGIWHE